MSLAAFIRENTPPIIKEWQTFAERLEPAADGMSPHSLRNHIAQTLAFIADDIESPQSDSEQITKSRGEKRQNSTESPAAIHASLRLDGGFSIDQMASEYRALRASIVRLWMDGRTEVKVSELSELIRFNESVDQQLTESIGFYTKTLDRSRNMFLGILGHDLRNPLGAAKMSAQLALHIGPLNERQTMLMSQIVSSAGRATEIVEHLVDLARSRLGSGLPVIKQHMDMGFVTRQLVDETRVIHPGRKITLEASGDTEGEWDRARIGQVLSNLLSNAVQYGFTDMPICVTIKGSTEEVVLSVHNDGVPIPPAAMAGIFDSLVRGAGEDSDSLSHNLGLGLYITKAIVSAHNGTIAVTSSEKGGTEFIVRFPRSSRATKG
jgi:signal transduction histidine kinase